MKVLPSLILSFILFGLWSCSDSGNPLSSVIEESVTEEVECTLDLDCNGVCGGTSVQDTCGVCDGDAFVQTYWDDNDGDGLGSDISDDFCTADVPLGWVLNSDDEDDDCYSNYHDCAGVCNGFAQVNNI